MGRADSPLGGRLIFAVGARRSGTNWLQRLLTAAPGVAGMPTETYLFADGVKQLSERFQHDSPEKRRTGSTYMERERLLDALRDFTDRVFIAALDRIDPQATRLVERTPWHVYHLELLADVYPDARFVHIVRDGRDVVRSMLSQRWPLGPHTMEQAAEEWRSSVAAGRRAAPALGERYRELVYERALASPRAEIEALYDWLGLGTDPQTIETALAEAGVELNVDPLSPRVAAGKWRDDLSARDLRTFERIGGGLLAELGYERVPARRIVSRVRPRSRRRGPERLPVR